MMAMVTPDMLSETTVHIAGDDAVAVGPGYRWAVGVSFRKMNRPHPLGGLGGERGLDVAVGLNRRGGPEVPHRVVVVDQLLPIRHGGLGFERGDDERPHLLRRVLHDDDAQRAIAAEGVAEVLHHRAQDVGWPIGRGRAVPVRVHEVAVCIGESDGSHESHPIVDCDRQHDRDRQQKR